MRESFLLPDVGEGLTEADIVAWHVAVGDRVEVNEVILDVETAKAVVELPSPYAGVVVELHAVEGVTLAVGSPLITIDAAAPSVTPAAVEERESESQPDSEPEPEASLVLVGTGPRAGWRDASTCAHYHWARRHQRCPSTCRRLRSRSLTQTAPVPGSR